MHQPNTIIEIKGRQRLTNNKQITFDAVVSPKMGVPGMLLEYADVLVATGCSQEEVSKHVDLEGLRKKVIEREEELKKEAEAAMAKQDTPHKEPDQPKDS
jgi:hypothetical protein